MEHCRGEDEDAEEDDLHEKTADNDLFANFDHVELLGTHETTTYGESALVGGDRERKRRWEFKKQTSGLHEEGKDVASDEDCSHPGPADEEVVVASDQLDDPPQFHVNGCREKCRGDQSQHTL
jgi:hypothetical protein